MKILHIIILFLCLIQNGYSQISIANIQKTESNSCEGSTVIVREDESVAEIEVNFGSLTFNYEFETNTIFLPDLCVGLYVVTYKDDTNCDYSLEFSLDNCSSIQISSTSTPVCHDTPPNIPAPCSMIEGWLDIFNEEVIFPETTSDPIILVQTSDLDKIANPDNPDGWNIDNSNDLLNNEKRTLGFIILHSIGHLSDIIHSSSGGEEYSLGFGFMGAGVDISYDLRNSFDPDTYLDEPTFEDLINKTIILEPNHIVKIKQRFNQ